MTDDEQALAGGNASGEVVRLGATIRKPWTDATAGVHAVLRSLRANGVDAPEPFGGDERGRQVLEYVPGRLAMDAPPLTADELRRVGGMVRTLHDTSERLRLAADPALAGVAWDDVLPAPGAGLICHNDLAPWNLIVGDRWVFIDWDGAGPSTRLWDLAYAAQSFTLNDPTQPPREAADRLRAFVAGYDADRGLRERLPDAMADRAAAMHELLRSAHAAGREPWGTMFVEGHGAHWAGVTDYVREHRSVWAAALATGEPSA